MANPQYYFTITADRDGYRARFYGNFGRRLIWWTEAYERRQQAVEAIGYLRSNATTAPLL